MSGCQRLITLKMLKQIPKRKGKNEASQREEFLPQKTRARKGKAKTDIARIKAIENQRRSLINLAGHFSCKKAQDVRHPPQKQPGTERQVHHTQRNSFY